MTAAATIVDLAWIIARRGHLCDEDGAEILPGDRMAMYDDVACCDLGVHLHTRRRYCEPCGKLLEDSLTTTEAD